MKLKERNIKLVLDGIALVTTMLKVIIQHRGQIRKGR